MKGGCKEMAEETVRVELELPKEVYDFLMLSFGSEKGVKGYLTKSLLDCIKSDFDALQGGGSFAEALYERFREAISETIGEP